MPNGQSSLPTDELVSEAPFGLPNEDASPPTLIEAELGNSRFSRKEIRDLFKLFYASFHPHMPIIDTTIPVQTIKQSSPFLFWTIVFIASRFHTKYVAKSNLLVESYSDLVNRTILKPPHSFHTIQGILYLCTWPLPVMRQPQDPSSMYSAIAVHSASYLGLPLAANPTSRTLAGLESNHRHTMAKTWLGCFITSTSLSLMLGLPPPLRSPNDLHTIESMIRLDNMPNKLVIEAEIQRCLAKHHDIIVGEINNLIRDNIVQMCDQELDSITTRLQCSFDSHLSFSFWMAKLHLYTLALVKETQPLKDRRQFEPDSLCAKLQQMAMTTAYRIIDMYCNEIVSASDDPSDEELVNGHIALPKSYFFGVMVATFFLLKYFVLNKTCPAECKVQSRRKVQMVHTKLQEYSSHQFTEPGRAASVIEILCRGNPESVEMGSEIEVGGGASIALDALIAAANIRGKRNLKSRLLQKLNPIPAPSASRDPQPTKDDLNRQEPPDSIYELLEETASLPEDVWGQSFMEMLDFHTSDLSSEFGEDVFHTDT
ncbi:MAG: hypothetical protein CMP47_14275 [Rickettsiales bacterium]|nr:hypothetical protein [Rickettsiales bacterium]